MTAAATVAATTVLDEREPCPSWQCDRVCDVDRCRCSPCTCTDCWDRRRRAELANVFPIRKPEQRKPEQLAFTLGGID